MPKGTQLVQSMTVSLAGVTTDGYAVYGDSADGSLHAISLSGGSAVNAGSFDPYGYTATSGSLAYSFSNLNFTTYAGAFSVWTEAHGSVALGQNVLETSFGSGSLAANADGSSVIYLDNVTSTTADVMVASTAGTGAKALVSNVSLSESCFPVVGFAGSYAVAQYCLASDPGATTATLATFTGTNWATTATLASDTQPDSLAIDPTGVRLLYVRAAGLYSESLATNSSSLLDANGVYGLFTSDGTHVVYLTAAGGISLLPAAGGGTATSLEPSGYEGIVALSPNNEWALAYKTSSSTNYGEATDLYLVPATAPGTATTLSSAANTQILGTPFTTDSSHALFGTTPVQAGATFTAAAASGAPLSYGQATTNWLAATGASAVFNIDSNSLGSSTGTAADLEFVDTSGTAAPTLLVSQANLVFAMAPALDKVVYSWSAVAGTAGGIWVQPLP